ncbi:MAG: hypothetical protein KKE00_12215, partial [Proteobacteria bacterium]|nr:hypothetical protein [Pseudomonadota bacterium]MBU1571256.1 hypothetical protein [Pseudomonadota bacterium]
MSRKNSIAALIKKSRYSMVSLKNDYQASLKAKEVSEELKVDIKNILENLRSCLDYIARDVYDKFIHGTPGRLYFPIRHTPNEFQQAISRDYSGLDQSAPNLYTIIEQVQPYNDPWLGKFNRLNNDNKHEDLVEQTRTEYRRVTVSSKSGGGSVSWGPGVTFGPGVSVVGVPIDPRTQMPVSNKTTDTKVEIWVDFKFRDNNESVIPFLDKSVNKVESLC